MKARPTRMRCCGCRGLAMVYHLVREVQVYRAQGVPIHDKHIEVIVRQMPRRVTIIDSLDGVSLPGLPPTARGSSEAENRVVAEGGASPRPVSPR